MKKPRDKMTFEAMKKFFSGFNRPIIRLDTGGPKRADKPSVRARRSAKTAEALRFRQNQKQATKAHNRAKQHANSQANNYYQHDWPSSNAICRRVCMAWIFGGGKIDGKGQPVKFRPDNTAPVV